MVLPMEMMESPREDWMPVCSWTGVGEGPLLLHGRLPEFLLMLDLGVGEDSKTSSSMSSAAGRTAQLSTAFDPDRET